MIEVALHSQSNPAYMEVHRSLLQQWNPLYRRALELQVCPLAPGMPRSIAGDIAGIPRQLVLGMESLGERINEEEVRRGLAETDFERVVVDDAVLKDDEPAATGSQGRLLTQLEASEASGIWSLTLLELICMKEIPGHDLDIPERPAESIEHFLRRAQRHNCTYEADIERLLKRIHILEYFDYVPDKVKQLEKDQADAAWGG